MGYSPAMQNRQVIIGGIMGIAVLALILLVAKPVSLPQGEEPISHISETGTTCERRLESRDFRVREVYDGPRAEVKFDDNDPLQKDPHTGTVARSYRSVIRGAAAGGPNFAGEYAVATWGSGTGQQGSAVVNVRTGRIIKYSLKSREGLRHSSSSSLLIVNPVPDKESYPPDIAPYIDYVSQFNREYYAVENGELVLLCEENAAEGIE
jgi:hypothetical protein